MGDATVLQLLEETEKHVRAALARRAAFAGTAPLRLIIHVLEARSSTNIPKLTFVIHCGRGDQTFRWLSLAVATRMQRMAKAKDGALRTRDNHELSGFYLPASVNTSKSAQLALDPSAEGNVQPGDTIRSHCRDGDEVFVTMSTKPVWDEACASERERMRIHAERHDVAWPLPCAGNIAYTAWQDAAYHRYSEAAAQRQKARADAIERDTRLATRLTKLREAGWDVGTAIRMQKLIGAATTAPAAPLPVAFGLSRAPSMTSPLAHAGGAMERATSNSSNAGAAEAFALGAGLTTAHQSEDLAAATPWLSNQDLGAMFESDWNKLQCIGLLPSTRERDALRGTLQRAFPAIRDVFRYYSNILNASAATRDMKEVVDAFKMSRSELEVFLRDCRILSGATMPFILPGHVVNMLCSGELRKQASAMASTSGVTAGAPAAGEPSSTGVGKAFDFAGTTMAGDREGGRFIGEITSPMARRAVMALKPNTASVEAPAPETVTGVTPLGGARSMLAAAGGRVMGTASTQAKGLATPSSPEPGARRMERGLRQAPAASSGGDKSPRAGGRPNAHAARPLDELDRAAFIDALVIISAGLWEATKGDKGALEAVRAAQLLSSNSLSSPMGQASIGADAGKRPGGAAPGVPAPFVSPRVLPGATASLSANKLPAVRAHMVAHMMSTYVIPRSKKVQASVGVRRELATRKVSMQIVRELPMLRQAFRKYANLGTGDDVAMDLAGWRKMLVDVGLYQRVTASTVVLPPRDTVTSAPTSPMSPGGGRGTRSRSPLSPKGGAQREKEQPPVMELDAPAAGLSEAASSADLLRLTGLPSREPSEVSTFAGLDNLKGKRLTEREVVMVFLQAQSEDEGAMGVAETDMDNMVAGVAAGARGMTASISTTASGLKELSFSEWIEALARVALTKWDDPAMATHEKLARVIDSIAVRMMTDPQNAKTAAGLAVHEVSRVAAASQRAY